MPGKGVAVKSTQLMYAPPPKGDGKDHFSSFPSATPCYPLLAIVTGGPILRASLYPQILRRGSQALKLKLWLCSSLYRSECLPCTKPVESHPVGSTLM